MSLTSYRAAPPRAKLFGKPENEMKSANAKASIDPSPEAS
jgi:hypothetical protein